MKQDATIIDDCAKVIECAPGFDVSFYRATYPDIRAFNLSEAELENHWMVYGRQEVALGRRFISPDFNESKYFFSRPDVKAAVENGVFINGYDHWLRFGRSEGLNVALLRRPATKPSILSDEMIEFWDRNGYLVLEGLISADRCERVSQRIAALWADRIGAPAVSIDVSLHNELARRIRFKEADNEDRHNPYKLNDLFLFEECVQDLALDENLCSVLRWILDADPTCCASLNFERGSTQTFHQDTLYMPGKTTGGMTASWFALEDVSPAAGPLIYYPGSHRIPLYYFSTKRPHQVDDEFGDYHKFMFDQVKRLGLTAETFLARKGDVLIWHERLFHSGSPITDLRATRRSLVTHYWRADELPFGNSIPIRGGSIWNREPV